MSLHIGATSGTAVRVSKPSLAVSSPSANRATARKSMVSRAVQEKETTEKSTSTQPTSDRFNLSGSTPDVEQLRNDGLLEDGASGKKLLETVNQMPAEQQQAIADLYMYLVQHPDAANLQGFSGWYTFQKAFDQYQVLLWRPAELLNGRMAMLGFVAAVGCQALTGASIWVQQAVAPYSFLFAYLVVIGAAQLNKQFGSPKVGIEAGPVKFDRRAELFNGRAAMFGYSLLAFLEYRSDITRAALYWAQNLQNIKPPGTSI